MCVYIRIFVIVKLCFIYTIFASYLLQFYVLMDFLEPPLLDLIRAYPLEYYYPRRHELIKTVIRMAFRTILVLITGECAEGRCCSAAPSSLSSGA